MGSIIAAHNSKVLAPRPVSNTPIRTCNCRRNAVCPLDGKCLTECFVYKASVLVPNKPTMVYYGTAEGTFKSRLYNHNKSFKFPRYSKDTELSKYLWELREQNLDARIRWEIAQRAAPYQCGSRRCDLCLTEKTLIALANPKFLLNKRSELVSSCLHRRKYSCAEVLKKHHGNEDAGAMPHE